MKTLAGTADGESAWRPDRYRRDHSSPTGDCPIRPRSQCLSLGTELFSQGPKLPVQLFQLVLHGLQLSNRHVREARGRIQIRRWSAGGYRLLQFLPRRCNIVERPGNPILDVQLPSLCSVNGGDDAASTDARILQRLRQEGRLDTCCPYTWREAGTGCQQEQGHQVRTTFGAEGGSRTHTSVRKADFKSAASAISPPRHDSRSD